MLNPNTKKALARFEKRGLILDAGGNPLKASATSYLAASSTEQGLATWQPIRSSADAEILPEMDAMVGRQRDLLRNSGLAAGALQTMVDNVIGSALRLKPAPNWQVLGLDAEWAKDFKAEIKARWADWANTPACDAQEKQNLGMLATLFFKGAFANGDGLALPVWEPGMEGPASTRLWVIESDRLSNPQNRMDALRLRGGVELDKYGGALAYHIRKNHPGDAHLNGAFTGAITGEWRRIPAKTAWGRKRVIHGYRMERAGQSRGVPTAASVMADSRMLDHYTKTELKAAIVNSLLAAFIQTPLGQEGVDEILGRLPGMDVDPSTGDQVFDPAAYLHAVNQYRAKLSGGGVFTLLPGEEANFLTPAHPGANFPAFVKTLQTNLARGYGISRHALTQDVDGANYGSIRVNLLNDWKFYTGRRFWLAFSFYQPGYELWFEEKVNLNAFEALRPVGSFRPPNYYEHKAAYTAAKWGGPGRGWIDPTKEATAAKIRVDNFLSTLEEECAEQGLELEEVLEQRDRELGLIREIAEKHGLALAPPAQIAVQVNDNPPKDNENEE